MGSEGGIFVEEGNDKARDGGKTSKEAEGNGAGEGLERVSAAIFSGPGTWTMEFVTSAR